MSKKSSVSGRGSVHSISESLDTSSRLSAALRDQLRDDLYVAAARTAVLQHAFEAGHSYSEWVEQFFNEAREAIHNARVISNQFASE
jgi:hypothetical protein